ncbi:hypothetical protein LN650_17515 [Klebsiella pneumoniae subsp. pneumoniae]|nr:hypothetical protein [Klebsiella pneumoniae subsp. pneumoniae]
MLVVDYLNAKWAQDPKDERLSAAQNAVCSRELRRVFPRQGQKWEAAGRPAWTGGKWVKQDDIFKSSFANVVYTVPAGFRS